MKSCWSCSLEIHFLRGIEFLRCLERAPGAGEYWMLSLRIGGGNQKLEPLPWMHFAELIFPASDAFPIDIAPGSSNSLKSKFSRSFTDGGHHRNAPIRVKFNILTPTARNMKADRCTLQSATRSFFIFFCFSRLQLMQLVWKTWEPTNTLAQNWRLLGKHISICRCF